MSYRKYHVHNKIRKIKPKQPVFLNKWFWVAILFFILVFTIFYILFFIPGFQVKNIEITGNSKLAAADLNLKISQFVNRKIFDFGQVKIFSRSIFLVNKDELHTGLLKDYPEISTASVKIKYPQTLLVDISERKAAGIFCDNKDKCFFVDGAGVIYEEIQDSPEKMFIVRQLAENKEAFAGEKVIAQNIIEFISRMDKNLSENFQISIKEALISTPIRLDITTSEGWQIYFEIGESIDIAEQLTKLDALLSQEITPQMRSILEYIDLRFKDRAYYK